MNQNGGFGRNTLAHALTGIGIFAAWAFTGLMIQRAWTNSTNGSFWPFNWEGAGEHWLYFLGGSAALAVAYLALATFAGRFGWRNVGIVVGPLLVWLLCGVALQGAMLDHQDPASLWFWNWPGAGQHWLHFTVGTVGLIIFAVAVYLASNRFGWARTICVITGGLTAYLTIFGEDFTGLKAALQLPDDLWIKALAALFLTIVLSVIVYLIYLSAIACGRLVTAFSRSVAEWWERRSNEKAAVHARTLDRRIARAEYLSTLPGADLASTFIWITAVAMTVSTITTAIGFEWLVMDDNRSWFYRWAISSLCSGAASLIIWGLWLPGYRLMITTTTVFWRIWAVIVGFAIVVPITIGLSTGLGIVGVGGEKAMQIDHRRYTNLLDVAAQLAASQREAELASLDQLRFLAGGFEDFYNVEISQGSVCGRGEGDLSRFYSGKRRDLLRIIATIEGNQNLSDPSLIADLKRVRDRITNPTDGVLFIDDMGQIGVEFKQLRERIVTLEANSPLAVLRILDQQLEGVKDDAFFTGWQSCQSGRRGQIRAQVASLQASLQGIIEGVESRAKEQRETLVERMGGGDEFRALEQGIVPEFFPLDPFFALLKHWQEMPMIAVVQIVLDLSPAFLALAFACLVPLNKRDETGNLVTHRRWTWLVAPLCIVVLVAGLVYLGWLPESVLEWIDEFRSYLPNLVWD